MNNTIIPYTPEYYEQTAYNRYLIREAQRQAGDIIIKEDDDKKDDDKKEEVDDIIIKD